MVEANRSSSQASAPCGASYRVLRDAAGGFLVEAESGEPVVTARVAGEGWTVTAGADRAMGRLSRDPSFPGGFVVEDPAEGEDGLVGRTTREGGRAGLPASLLARDGRLFRVVARWSGEPCFDLVGQESPGAYLRSRRGEGVVTIERTIAGRELDLAPEILLLFAAEILDAER